VVPGYLLSTTVAGTCKWETITMKHVFNLSSTGPRRHTLHIAYEGGTFEPSGSSPEATSIAVAQGGNPCKDQTQDLRYRVTVKPGKEPGTASIEDDSETGNRATLKVEGGQLKITYNNGTERLADPI
jgi:hypothetical protein